LHESLELVPLLFGFLGGVKEVDSERHDYKERWKGVTRRILWIRDNKVSEFKL